VDVMAVMVSWMLVFEGRMVGVFFVKFCWS
jgi:hypothetical protein